MLDQISYCIIKQKKSWFTPCLLLLGSGFFGAILFFVTSNYGLGTSPDSIAYLKGAMGFLDGHGYSYVSVEWPPLYPTLLILFGKITGGDVMLGARLLQSTLYGVNFLLIAFIFYRCLKLSSLFSCLLAGLICIQPPMVYIHFYAWSEPSLILFLLGDLYLLCILARPGKQAIVIEVGLICLATAALMTRFAGLTVVVLNSAIIFLYTFNKLTLSRILRVCVQLVVPILFFIPWLNHRGIANGPATERDISFHSMSLLSIEFGLETVGKWFTPISAVNSTFPDKYVSLIIGSIVIVAVLFVCVPRLIFSIGKRNLDTFVLSTSQQKLLIITSCYVIIYIGFMFSAISFVDNKVVMDDRILSPIFVCISIALISLLFGIRSRLVRLLALIVIWCVWMTAYPNFRAWLLRSYFNGIEMSDKSVKNKPIQQFVRTCLIAKSIYSDNPWNFDLIFNDKVRWLPRRILFNSGYINVNYIQEINALKDTTELIIVEGKDLGPIRDIEKLERFHRIYDEHDGIVYINNQSGSKICN
jgi:hypothetical protein